MLFDLQKKKVKYIHNICIFLEYFQIRKKKHEKLTTAISLGRDPVTGIKATEAAS